MWEPVLERLSRASATSSRSTCPASATPPRCPTTSAPTPAALATAVTALLDGWASASARRRQLARAPGWRSSWPRPAAPGRSRACAPPGCGSAPLTRDGRPARGRPRRVARRLRPLLPGRHAQPRRAPAALGPFVAHPDRVPYRGVADGQLVRPRDGLRGDEPAMREDHFRRAPTSTVPVTLAFGEHDRLVRPAPDGIADPDGRAGRLRPRADVGRAGPGRGRAPAGQLAPGLTRQAAATFSRQSPGGRSSAGRAPGCGPGGRGFESPRSPSSSRLLPTAPRTPPCGARRTTALPRPRQRCRTA